MVPEVSLWWLPHAVGMEGRWIIHSQLIVQELLKSMQSDNNSCDYMEYPTLGTHGTLNTSGLKLYLKQLTEVTH